MTVPPEVENLIADAPLSAHIATSVDDRPHVAPVWYGYSDGVLSVLTGGKKLRNVRRNPKVAVSIEKATENGVEWGVTMLGTARVIDDRDRMRAAEEHVFGKYRSDGGEDDGEANREGDEGAPERALVEIEIGSASWQTY